MKVKGKEKWYKNYVCMWFRPYRSRWAVFCVHRKSSKTLSLLMWTWVSEWVSKWGREPPYLYTSIDWPKTWLGQPHLWILKTYFIIFHLGTIPATYNKGFTSMTIYNNDIPKGGKHISNGVQQYTTIIYIKISSELTNTTIVLSVVTSTIHESYIYRCVHGHLPINHK